MNPAATPESSSLSDYCSEYTDTDFDDETSMADNECRSISKALDPLTNDDLKKSEFYRFLLEFLEAPQKHCVWAEAAKELRSLEHCSVQQIIQVLTTGLQLAQRDENNIQSLRKRSFWKGVPSFTWLPQSVCRSIGHQMRDKDGSALEKLEAFNKSISQMTTDIIMKELELRRWDREDPGLAQGIAMWNADDFLDLMLVFSRHNRVIEGQIEYLKWMAKNAEN